MVLRGLRQEDCQFEASLGYLVGSYLKKNRQGEKGRERKRNKKILSVNSCHVRN